MTRARKHPTVDRIITVLQDKRFEMTKPTKSRIYNCRCCRISAENVIFIALGVVFLLGVIVVIIYTSLFQQAHELGRSESSRVVHKRAT
uniref:Movement protein n=1 Tax=Macrostomum lignano TaxID=282301 RepID=A0A1I8FAY8_9PLAT